MKRKFNIAMLIAWVFITISYIAIAIAGIKVSAINVVWPSLLCINFYLDRILNIDN